MFGKLASALRTPGGRDSVMTTLTEGISMLGMVLVFRLSKLAGDEDFDRYVIVRRTVAFAFPVVLMGTMVGLTRFISMGGDDATRRRLLRGALSWVVPLGIALCLVCALLPGPLSWLCFGDYDEADLVLPIGLMTFGIALHGVAYGYLRGCGTIAKANIIQLFALAITPCAAFFLFKENLLGVLVFTGAGWTIASLVAIVPALLVRGDGTASKERSEIVRYGLPRVPGDIALGALLTIPVYVVVRTFGQELGAEYAFACTLLNLAAAAFSPVALLLLPAAAGQLASGDFAALADRVGKMVLLVLAASVLLVLSFELLATPLLRVYLGPTGEDFVATSRLVFLAAFPFAFFNGMRSLLDAYFPTPRNGVNLVVSFGILLIGSALHLFVKTPWYTMGAVLFATMGYLGYATWRDVRYVREELNRLAGLRPEDIHVLVVIPDAEDGDGYAASREQAKAFERSGARVTLFHLKKRRSVVSLFRARQRLKHLTGKARPDVVHVHFGSVTAIWAVFSSAMPVVVTYMGSDLDRREVKGVARPFLGGLFSQLAAFFAAGIICTDEALRERLWWRDQEAIVVPMNGDARSNADRVLEHLRRVALHRPSTASVSS